MRLVNCRGAKLIYFDEVEQIEIELPLGKLIRKIALPKPLLEADVVIACPSLKPISSIRSRELLSSGVGRPAARHAPPAP